VYNLALDSDAPKSARQRRVSPEENMKRRIIYILMLLFLACRAAYALSDEDFKRWQFIDDFVFNGIPLSLDTSDADIRALGRVIKIETEEYEALHDKGLMLEMRTYHLDGLEVVAHFAKGVNSKGQLSKAVVTKAKWKINKGLRIGSPIDLVINTLGEPTTKSEGTYSYCGETSIDCAIFEFSKNKVTKITFTYYLD
jgi:hypothetical protein